MPEPRKVRQTRILLHLLASIWARLQTGHVIIFFTVLTAPGLSEIFDSCTPIGDFAHESGQFQLWPCLRLRVQCPSALHEISRRPRNSLNCHPCWPPGMSHRCQSHLGRITTSHWACLQCDITLWKSLHIVGFHLWVVQTHCPNLGLQQLHFQSLSDT